MRRLVAAQHHGRPGHSLRPDQSDFDLGLIGLDGNDRGDTGLHEIDGIDPPIGSFDLVSHGDRKEIQVRLQQRQIRWRQRCQEPIAQPRRET
jgi:hypothetical protein